MKRREFITLVGVAAAWPLAARAQQAERVRRIGVIDSGAADDPHVKARNTAFLEALQQLGWTDGRNVRIDVRWAAADAERIRKLCAKCHAYLPRVFGRALTSRIHVVRLMSALPPKADIRRLGRNVR